MSDKYNGWTNYETWNVNLWIDNDEWAQSYWREQVEGAKDVEALAEALKTDYEERAGELNASDVFGDFLNASLARVNWDEIAAAIWQDAGMDEPEEPAELILPDAQALAREFSSVIRNWLSADKMAEVIKLNSTEANLSICHTHDFCDPNEAMSASWEKLTGQDFDTQSDEASNRWDEAWAIAKANNFAV